MLTLRVTTATTATSKRLKDKTPAQNALRERTHQMMELRMHNVTDVSLDTSSLLKEPLTVIHVAQAHTHQTTRISTLHVPIVTVVIIKTCKANLVASNVNQESTPLLRMQRIRAASAVL
jgi:hypothetical protein